MFSNESIVKSIKEEERGELSDSVSRGTKREKIYWFAIGFVILFISLIRIRLLSFPLERDEGEYAYAEPYGDSEKVPIFERFFAGGATTIRGYRERSIGPDDENDEAIGGNTRIVLTSEIIIPIQKDIRFVTFFDMGDVYGSDENIDFSTFRKGVGAGVRVSTPFGLLRFDWGYKLDNQDAYEDDEKDYEFHFGLGNIF